MAVVGSRWDIAGEAIINHIAEDTYQEGDVSEEKYQRIYIRRGGS